jgi:hypothetical protein
MYGLILAMTTSTWWKFDVEGAFETAILEFSGGAIKVSFSAYIDFLFLLACGQFKRNVFLSKLIR